MNSDALERLRQLAALSGAAPTPPSNNIDFLAQRRLAQQKADEAAAAADQAKVQQQQHDDEAKEQQHQQQPQQDTQPQQQQPTEQNKAASRLELLRQRQQAAAGGAKPPGAPAGPNSALSSMFSAPPPTAGRPNHRPPGPGGNPQHSQALARMQQLAGAGASTTTAPTSAHAQALQNFQSTQQAQKRPYPGAPGGPAPPGGAPMMNQQTNASRAAAYAAIPGPSVGIGGTNDADKVAQIAAMRAAMTQGANSNPNGDNQGPGGPRGGGFQRREQDPNHNLSRGPRPTATVRFLNLPLWLDLAQFRRDIVHTLEGDRGIVNIMHDQQNASAVVLLRGQALATKLINKYDKSQAFTATSPISVVLFEKDKSKGYQDVDDLGKGRHFENHVKNPNFVNYRSYSIGYTPILTAGGKLLELFESNLPENRVMAVYSDIWAPQEKRHGGHRPMARGPERPTGLPVQSRGPERPAAPLQPIESAPHGHNMVDGEDKKENNSDNNNNNNTNDNNYNQNHNTNAINPTISPPPPALPPQPTKPAGPALGAMFSALAPPAAAPQPPTLPTTTTSPPQLPRAGPPPIPTPSGAQPPPLPPALAPAMAPPPSALAAAFTTPPPQLPPAMLPPIPAVLPVINTAQLPTIQPPQITPPQ